METHPYLRFPQHNNDAAYLILGSIPPPRFCIKNADLQKFDVPFFYGSQDNAFWDLFISAMQLPFHWPVEHDLLKTWLSENHWCISDIVLETNRVPAESANDAALRPVQWNHEVIDGIFGVNPIQHVFFTSKWVASKFDLHVKPKLTALPEHVKFHTLISPSPSGLRRTQWAQAIFPLLPDEGLPEYRQRFYEHVLRFTKVQP